MRAKSESRMHASRASNGGRVRAGRRKKKE